MTNNYEEVNWALHATTYTKGKLKEYIADGKCDMTTLLLLTVMNKQEQDLSDRLLGCIAHDCWLENGGDC